MTPYSRLSAALDLDDWQDYTSTLVGPADLAAVLAVVEAAQEVTTPDKRYPVEHWHDMWRNLRAALARVTEEQP